MIKLPLCFTETGKRQSNQDSIYPRFGTASVNDRIFLVCDGVGGNAGGEVASSFVCTRLSELISGHQGDLGVPSLVEYITKTQSGLVEFAMEYPELTGMATTLTLLCMRDDGAWCVHIGDSRIYHIRGGSILYKSADHSYVGQLLRAGLLSEEEARNHPKKNVITRAVTSYSTDKPEAEIRLITDLMKGDYLLLCTDGVVEGVSDEELLHTLGRNIENSQKIDYLQRLCAQYAKDNYSAYLIEMDRDLSSDTTEILNTSPA